MKPFDDNGAFRAPEAEGLRRRAIRSAGVTVLAQSVSFAVQIAATIVLARLLMPGDFGVVAMVTTFSVMLSYVGQVGFPEAVLQREEITHFLASNLFWINLTIGAALTLGFAGCGPVLARFYKDPQVAAVAVAASLTIFLTCGSVMHLALLKRGMRFSAVSANDIVARAVSVVLSIVLAWAGWGYWALVAGVVAQPFSILVGAWILCPWVPSLPRRSKGTGSMVRFATHVYGSFTVDYCTHNMDYLLVGWRLGPISLGFYKKAYEMFVLPANQFLSAYPVAVATLSRLTRDREQYRRYLIGGISLLAFASMGIGADLTLVGKDLVHFLLGPKWAESGRLFTFFGPGIGAMLVYRTQGMIHLSLGTTKRFFRWAVIEFFVTGTLFLVGLPWGAKGIALAWTLSSWILLFPSFWYAGRPINIGFVPIFSAIWRYMLASVLAAGGCLAALHAFPTLAAEPGGFGALIRILVTSGLFAFLYLGSVILLHGGAGPLYNLAALLREMAPWHRSSRRVGVEDPMSGVQPGPLLAPLTTEEQPVPSK